MAHRGTLIMTFLVTSLTSQAANACRDWDAAVLEDVKYADAIVVGRVSDYHIVRDEDFRKRMLAIPTLSEDLRKIYEDPHGGLISDYAKFDVTVDEVLAGEVPTRFSVTWYNSTFGKPKQMRAGPFLIALRKTTSKAPPLRGPSATIMPNREPNTLTVLQAPCSAAFIFDAPSDEAQSIRKIVAAQRR